MAKGVRRKSLSKIIAVLAIATFAVWTGHADAFVKHRHPEAAKKSTKEEAAPIPLTGIHVLGDRPAPFALNAKAVMLIDGSTGAVLYSYNEHEKMQPASLAKIMTFYLPLCHRLALRPRRLLQVPAWAGCRPSSR